MPKSLDEIDRRIFATYNDGPFNAIDEVYSWFAARIDGFDRFDRAGLCQVEIRVSMLWRLASYFGGSIMSKRDAAEWRDAVLVWFDEETAKRGDAHDVADWRANIAQNFDRLISVLEEDDAPPGYKSKKKWWK